MMNPHESKEKDPMFHVSRIRNEFSTLIDHLRDDNLKVNDPQAKALFETSAEVLEGLRNAFDHYKGGGQYWR
jgi:hypothetical protein